ncbi:hypothetical protein F8M41_019356 [Gigaspora margarita]|uniref:Uncharacterized protein n=1 Tax=Gigaspora margarita TaxID=4874 RepID=A0A8H4B5J7_GIGMA|nr:hypothetical protein F8M41_019356 [Gigaspora margarita]
MLIFLDNINLSVCSFINTSINKLNTSTKSSQKENKNNDKKIKCIIMANNSKSFWNHLYVGNAVTPKNELKIIYRKNVYGFRYARYNPFVDPYNPVFNLIHA